MSQKVGSEEWGQSVPPTCDWRKKAGIISSIRNQVSAPMRPGPIQPWWREGEERGKACIPYPTPILLPLAKLQLLLGHGSSGQHRGPVGHQIPSVSGSLRARYGWGRGPV